ncbi:ABC transporter substrate-binding protein [Teichococcus aestuarii]|uniref:ABC transporter substrate-binding protein n=1 Tax=Teichococcus aestuarii TaxID=568898 RepID=A0A2U1V9U0_9PROT|nr:ABC transporter substrate-binding protein [Pseudoroseomonas aestuarii]PWC30682.1 hypothetical protein CR165_01890 [Pseudoroseomonas aestuarii]
MITRRGLLAGLPAALAAGLPRRRAAAGTPLDGAAALLWEALRQNAWGRTLRFHLTAEDPGLEGFLGWMAAELAARHGIGLDIVPLRDEAEAVSRVASGEGVDLVALDAGALLALRQQDLLLPARSALPNAAPPPPGAPEGGFGVPWHGGGLVLVHDAAQVPEPPPGMLALPDWARARPGRLAHPTPRHALGAAFLLQALHELVPHPRLLESPATDRNFTLFTAPFWEWYGSLRPFLWRQGQAFPEGAAALRRLLRSGEIALMPALHPIALPRLVRLGEWPPSSRAQTLGRGSMAHAALLAVPRAAAQPEAAMLAANFLLSPEAQARMADPHLLGRLAPPAPRPRPEALLATPPPPDMPRLPEPHPSWALRLRQEWERRMGALTQ